MVSFIVHPEDSSVPERSSDEQAWPPARNETAHDGPRVVVAIPAFNEEIAIGSLVLRTLKYADEVVVIDDGSEDHTAEVARLAGARVITHEQNEGKGAGIRDAFAYVADNGADVLVLMDGDGQHDPDEIPPLIRPILEKKADLVNGSRFLAKGRHFVPGYRRLGQGILDIATNAGTGRKITDTQNGFRAFSRRTFGCFSFMQTGMAIESEMLIEAADTKIRITEVPINVRYDVNGSTYNPVVHGFDVLNRVLGLVSKRRPLLFFCLPGTAMIGLGTVFVSVLLPAFNPARSLPVELVPGALLFVFLGMSLVSTGLTLSTIQRTSRPDYGR